MAWITKKPFGGTNKALERAISMLGTLIYIFLITIYIALPLPLQITFFLINITVPDPIPVLDELIMLISLCKKMRQAGHFLNFIDSHPILFKVLVFIIILGIVYLIIL